jgi:hypothetical protein
LTLVPVSAAIGAAAEPPQAIAADDVFSQMGLGGMQPISDEQGTQVRGKGFRGHKGGGFKIQIQVNVAVVHAYKSFVSIHQSNSIR